MSTIVMACLALWAQDPPKPAPVATALRVRSFDVEIGTTDRMGRVRISLNKGAQAVEFDLPAAANRVSQIVAAPWCGGGIAMVIEARSADRSGRTYYWATLNKGGLADGLEKPVFAPFLEHREEEHRLSLSNRGGDTLVITLTRNAANPDQEADVGYLFVHHCPVMANIGGELYTLRATPAKPR